MGITCLLRGGNTGLYLGTDCLLHRGNTGLLDLVYSKLYNGLLWKRSDFTYPKPHFSWEQTFFALVGPSEQFGTHEKLSYEGVGAQGRSN